MPEFRNNPTVVDAIIERDQKILLIQRGKDPFQGSYALPGGFVDFGETVENAVIREVEEECGIIAEPLAILGVYSGKERDPRGPIISTVFICKSSGKPQAGDDAATFQWIELERIDEIKLAFDHAEIVRDYLNWKKDETLTFWTSK